MQHMATAPILRMKWELTQAPEPPTYFGVKYYTKLRFLGVTFPVKTDHVKDVHPCIERHQLNSFTVVRAFTNSQS